MTAAPLFALRGAQSEGTHRHIGHPLALISGIDITRQMKAQLPRTEFLIFTMHEDEMLVAELLRPGARGYLLKSDADHYLIAAVKTLSSHKPFFTPNVSERCSNPLPPGRGMIGPLLLPASVKSFKLIAEGHTNKATGQILNNSLKTVETHRAKVIRKLDLSSTAALVRYAIRNKLIDL